MPVISGVDCKEFVLKGRKEVFGYFVFGVESIAVFGQFFFVPAVFVGVSIEDDYFVAALARRAKSRIVHNGAVSALKYRELAESCVDGDAGVKVGTAYSDHFFFTVVARGHKPYEMIRGIVQKVVIEGCHYYFRADNSHRVVTVGAVSHGLRGFLT